VVDLGDLLAPVLHRLIEGALELLDEVLGHPLELRAGEGHLQVQGPLGDEWESDGGLLCRGQLDLGLLGGVLEPLHGHAVLGEVLPVGVLELLDHPVDDLLVPVIPAEVRVPGGRLDLEDAISDLQQGDVERPTAEVEHKDRLVVLFVEAVRQ
jgi:hypothetical protein